jgi:Aspartyl protease
MFHAKCSALASFFFLLPSACPASHCPANVASVHVRHVQGSLSVVQVKLNHLGPYDFLVDTGAQITSIDSALAASLQVKAAGKANIVGVSSRTTHALARLDIIEIGSQAVEDPVVYVQDPTRLQVLDHQIRGVIGGDVLRHFDVLLDQGSSSLCLDNAGVMQKFIRGERIKLTEHSRKDADAYATEPLVVPVHLSGNQGRLVHLLLDSGTNVPYLWAGVLLPFPNARRLHVSSTEGSTKEVSILPPLNMDIGRNTYRQVSFAMPSGISADAIKMQVDGLLPIGLFRRVYIDYRDRFVVLESW